MKKIIVLALLLVIAVSLSSCGSQDINGSDPQKDLAVNSTNSDNLLDVTSIDWIATFKFDNWTQHKCTVLEYSLEPSYWNIPPKPINPKNESRGKLQDIFAIAKIMEKSSAGKVIYSINDTDETFTISFDISSRSLKKIDCYVSSKYFVFDCTEGCDEQGTGYEYKLRLREVKVTNP